MTNLDCGGAMLYMEVSQMIRYTMMDHDCIVSRCLHQGPVSFSEIRQSSRTASPAEAEFHIPPGTVARALAAICREYESCAVLAWDDDNVVGILRFYPTHVLNTDNKGCLLSENGVWTLARMELGLPERSTLPEQSLTLQCFQIYNQYYCHPLKLEYKNLQSYLHQGLGTGMLIHLIGWARSHGWHEIRARAIPHIRPLMLWSEDLSVERYRGLGFEVSVASERSDVAAAQRKGLHGPQIRRMWDAYEHVSDDEASLLYDVCLDITRPAPVSNSAVSGTPSD